MEALEDRNVDDGDAPTLSSQALAALQEFLREQSQSPGEQSEVALVTEDWRPSQFWYDCETAETVANEVLTLCSGSPSRVACIACPTRYAYLKDQREPLVDVIVCSLQLQTASVSLWLMFSLLPFWVLVHAFPYVIFRRAYCRACADRHSTIRAILLELGFAERVIGSMPPVQMRWSVSKFDDPLLYQLNKIRLWNREMKGNGQLQKLLLFGSRIAFVPLLFNSFPEVEPQGC